MPKQKMTADEWAEVTERAVRWAFGSVFTEKKWLASWEPHLQAKTVWASITKEKNNQIVRTWGGRKIGDLSGDPFMVAVLTEHAGYVRDPYADKESGQEWRAAMKWLSKQPFVSEVSWDSVNAGLHVVRIVPKMV